MQYIEFKTKPGTNKGVKKSRVWIEGKRLVDAGFTVGEYYTRTIKADSIRLLNIHASLALSGRVEAYKVSGKGEKPIIDITGRVITDRFKGTHVVVHYYKGMIEIFNA